LTHFHIQFCLHHQFIIDKQVHVTKQMDTHDDRRLYIDMITGLWTKFKNWFAKF
jgi:hypothetical protein